MTLRNNAIKSSRYPDRYAAVAVRERRVGDYPHDHSPLGLLIGPNAIVMRSLTKRVTARRVRTQARNLRISESGGLYQSSGRHEG